MEFSMTFAEFLAWLINGGGAIMAASWILERIPAFQNLSEGMKSFVAKALAAVLGLGALALITFAPDVIVLVQPYFSIIAFIFVSIFGIEMFHRVVNKKG